MKVLSVAPMMKRTDPWYRVLARLLSTRTLLYTEMVVSDALYHSQSNPQKFNHFLRATPSPVALQLGGNDPVVIGKVAEVVSNTHPHIDEINLNCGCPSDKVSNKGCFGARLMLSPELVKEIMSTMRLHHPNCTVKCRLGVDDVDSYASLKNFVSVVSEAGVTKFSVHARKCWLKGLNPKANRSVPPLRRDWVIALVDDFPNLRFTLNGGVESLKEVVDLFEECPKLEGVMVGRAAFSNPLAVLARADTMIYGLETDPYYKKTRVELLLDYVSTLEKLGLASNKRAACRPVGGLFFGVRGGKVFKRALDLNLKSKESLRSDFMKTFEDVGCDSEALSSLIIDDDSPLTLESSRP